MVKRNSGYTLIEMLVVMGIVLIMSTMALASVTSMLRGTRMSQAINLFVATADESRAKAVTFRRTARVDMTRLNPLGAGDLNRISVVGLASDEDFESYSAAAPGDPDFPDAALQRAWLSSRGDTRQVVEDNSHALLVQGSGGAAPGYYWNPGFRVAKSNSDDYEVIVEARVKILPDANRSAPRTIGILGCVSDNGSTMLNAYSLIATIEPTNVANVGPRNNSSTVNLGKISGSLTTLPTVIDAAGAPSATCCLVEGVWYRFLLSVKQITPPGSPSGTGPVTLAGKIWADGQLEPAAYTVGPVTDNQGLPSGFMGVFASNCDGLADDPVLDVRSMRLIPAGLRIDTFEPKAGITDPNGPGDYAMSDPVANTNSPYLFPLMFRPDGTSAVKSVLRISDMTTGDASYIVINPNTGRAMISHSLAEATAK